ncbi:MAG: hypothetical protein NTU43_01260 [Bacteroidetes bacterium]|nr:hypothetical protein [Bacteroidota bacterium]
MKLFYILILISINANAQNLILNGDFESLTEQLSFYNCNGGDPSTSQCSPFYHGKVPNWNSYSFTPEIVTSTAYPGISGNTGVYCIFDNTLPPIFYEGIFQQRDGVIPVGDGTFTREKIFKYGKSYLVRFRFKFINGSFGITNPSIKIMAGTFKKDRNLPGSTALNNLNDPNNETIGITSNSLAPNQWNTYTTFYTPTADKDGIAIVPIGLVGNSTTNAFIIFDDVSVTESCCSLSKEYINIVNPASANVQDFIRCSSNVTFNNLSYTDFRAKNEIVLANNTTISGVSTFVASSED